MSLSLHEHARSELVAFLKRAGMPHADVLADPLLRVIDRIHAYTEEGRRLYPELLVTPNLDGLLKTVAFSRTLTIGTAPIADVLARAMKSGAPLASSGWVIFVELREDGTARYGVASAESTDISPQIYDQLVGTLAVSDVSVPPVVYVRSRGTQTVELAAPADQRLVVRLGLGETAVESGAEPLALLAGHATVRVPDARRRIACAFVNRLLEDAVREAHGCLIAVVDVADASLSAFRAGLPDGIHLDEPVDLMQLLRALDEHKTRESSRELRGYMDLFKGMVSQDGITVLGSDGSVLAFNVFIRQAGEEAVVGGARRRAFAALRDSGLSHCAVAVSHDGGVTYWEARALELAQETTT